MICAEKKGAFAYIGSAPSSYWYEDYYFGVGATNVFYQMPTYEQTSFGVYDAVFSEGFNSISAVPFIGNVAVAYSHANGYQGSVSAMYCRRVKTHSQNPAHGFGRPVPHVL